MTTHKTAQPRPGARRPSASVCVLACTVLACALLAGCASRSKSTDERQSPAAFPAHLCDSRFPTDPVRRIYPEKPTGEVQTYRGDGDTGDLKHFMNKEGESGGSQWSCWVQFDGKDSQVYLLNVLIAAFTEETPSSFKELGIQTGYGSRTLSSGIVHGVNGPKRSALKFPCQVSGREKVTLLVTIYHHIDYAAPDAYRERVRRISADYVREIAGGFVNRLHPCKNMPKFPSGGFTSTPVPEPTTSQPSTDGG